MTTLISDSRLLRANINHALRDFLEAEEEYSDNAQLFIIPASFEAGIADEDEDLEERDYYPVMDLLMADADKPGMWTLDANAIDSVVDEYCPPT